MKLWLMWERHGCDVYLCGSRYSISNQPITLDLQLKSENICATKIRRKNVVTQPVCNYARSLLILIIVMFCFSKTTCGHCPVHFTTKQSPYSIFYLYLLKNTTIIAEMLREIKKAINQKQRFKTKKRCTHFFWNSDQISLIMRYGRV